MSTAKPKHIAPDCERCGSALVLHDSLVDTPPENWWTDEFECPLCRDGIYLDYPGPKWKLGSRAEFPW